MTALTECPTCHEEISCVWHDHHAVSSGHPEDDEPWCKHCGELFSELDGNSPDSYCRKVPTMPDTTNLPDDDDEQFVFVHDEPEAGPLDEERSVLPPRGPVLSALTAEGGFTGPADPLYELGDDFDDDDDVDELATIAASKQMVRDTYDLIVLALERRRQERDELEENIAALVEAEALWKPIVNRVENGPARRPRRAEATEPES